MRTGGCESVQSANGGGLASGIFFNQLDAPSYDSWVHFGSRLSKVP